MDILWTVSQMLAFAPALLCKAAEGYHSNMKTKDNISPNSDMICDDGRTDCYQVMQGIPEC